MTRRFLLLVAPLLLLACEKEEKKSVPAGGTGTSAVSSGGGDGGAGGAEPCTEPDVTCDGVDAETGVCLEVSDNAGTRLACVTGEACKPDEACRTEGVCALVDRGDHYETVCADGDSGDPCTDDEECDSLACSDVTTPAGMQRLCD